jgi:hypothetical protein
LSSGADGPEHAADPRPPLLVFVHIPKTAGTTMTAILRTNEPGAGTRHGGNVFKGGGGIKQGVKFQNLLRNTNGELDRARILTGHFPLAIREHLPNDRLVRYFTLLREPADRTLSHYFQIRDRRGGLDRPNKLGLPSLSTGATLDETIAGGYMLDNVQTRMLSGLAEPFGEVDDEMLERAKHNLRHGLACFGLTERLDESLVLAKQRLGLRTILYFPPTGSSAQMESRAGGRINTARPRGSGVPEELQRAAERCNRYDIELYGYAEQLFDAAPERQELEFEIELAALRAAKSDGDIKLDAPSPAGFNGDEEAWRMLLHARATAMRQQRELDELRALLETRPDESSGPPAGGPAKPRRRQAAGRGQGSPRQRSR